MEPGGLRREGIEMTDKVNYHGEPVERPDGTVTKLYRIAPTFAVDHWERECGQTDVIVKATRKGFTVEMDSAGYADMLSDADYYWECRDEMEMPELAASAKRVMASLKKAGPPEGAAAPVEPPALDCGCDARTICAEHVETFVDEDVAS
jgi:hypothetical protein